MYNGCINVKFSGKDVHDRFLLAPEAVRMCGGHGVTLQQQLELSFMARETKTILFFWPLKIINFRNFLRIDNEGIPW